MGIKRRDGGASGSALLPEVGWALQHPTLTAFLRDATYDDGKPRKTGTITVFVEDGAFKLCLSDRDVGETAWLTGIDLETLLDQAELTMEEGSLEWRKPYGANKRK